MFLRTQDSLRASRGFRAFFSMCRNGVAIGTLLLSAAGLAAPSTASAQGAPTVQGTYVPDNNNGPRIVSPSIYGTAFYALSGDLTTLRQPNLTGLPVTCAAPASADPAVNGPRAIVNDTQNAYILAPNTGGANVSVTALLFGSSVCTRANSLVLPGSLPVQAFLSNDVFHARLFALRSYNSGASDSLTVINNLNAGSGTTISQGSQTFLDTGATYSSMVTDVNSNYGLVAITELKTATSPGNLWVYSPGINVAFKILGPGGAALPASSAFIIPAKNDGGGNLLVLVNQDNLTAGNLATPPADTTPFTIIDLGQLQRTFSTVVASGNTITLPPPTSIAATSTYAAMLGAAFDPVTKLIYAAVGGGGSLASRVLSYDPYNPAAPAETNVADISNVPYAFGVYPQVAINSAAGAMQILTASPTGLYTFNVLGTGNTAVQVSGSTFPDGNFQPVQIASNPLLGQTYVASPASSQIDVLTRPAANPLRATVTLGGSDTAITNQSYYLKGTSLYTQGDTSLINATVTVTATPTTGTPITQTTTVGNIAYPGGSIPGFTFPTAGTYTIVATVPATATHAAITSNAIQVKVAANALAGVYPTTVTLSVPATSTTGTVTANLTLNGSTYAPTGRIVVSDASGEVGRYTFTGGATTYPVTATLTLANGASTLTATYNGDDQNATSTSAPSNITVGNGTKVTPTLALTVPSSGTAGNTSNGTVTLTSSTTTAPTDTISIYAVPSGSTTPTTLSTIPASQAFAPGGRTFIFAVPAAGNYTILAYYGGDANYNMAQSPTTAFTSNPAANNAAISLNPSSLDFTVLANTTSAYKDVTLTNTGSSALTLTSITVTGAGFSQINGCPASLAANANCAIRVQYSPGNTTNTVAGSIRVVDNAPGSPHTVGLTGKGYTAFGATSAFSSFDTPAVVGTSAFSHASLSLVNNSGGNITITSLTSTNAAEFSPGPGCVGSVVADGSTCTVLVAFHPSAPGNRTGAVSFNLSNGQNYGFGYSGSGQASGQCTDTDGDGLCDDWETRGVFTRVPGADDQFIDLPSMGADPKHKDIFIHIDYMKTATGVTGEHSHQFRVAADQNITQAFMNSPVTNPDGKRGIYLHVDCGSTCIMNPVTNATWGSASKVASVAELASLNAAPYNKLVPFDWTTFDNNSTAFKATGRSLIFHHTLMAHDQNPGYSSSGISRNGAQFFAGASDLIVSLGSWKNQTGTDIQQAGTLMHELGHNLALAHGGNENSNYKPNYLTVMNYNMQTVGIIVNGGSGLLDYSRYKLPDMNELKLNELVGLNADPKTYPGVSPAPSTDKYGTFWFCQGDNVMTTAPQYTFAINGTVNWNCDARKVNPSAPATPVFSASVSTDTNASGFGETLTSFDDWSNLVYSGGAVGGNGAAPDGTISNQPTQTQSDEITQEQNSRIVAPFNVTVSGPNVIRTAPGSTPMLRFTVANTGATADIYNLSVASSAWTIAPGTPATLTLAPGARSEVVVTYTVPPTAADGDGAIITLRAVSQTSTLTTDSMPVAVFATASPAPLTVSAATVVFGAQTVATASPVSSVVLTNTGSGPLTFPAITATGDFRASSNCPATLVAGAACTVDVVYTPTALGTRGGTLSITSSASATAQTVALSGLSTAAPLARPTVDLAVKTTSNLAYQPVTFTATVAQPSGTAVPAGTVTFFNDDQSLGQATLVNGTATFTTSALGGGTYNVYASYSGDASFASSNSASQGLVLSALTSSSVALKVSSPQTVLASPVTFTATITPATATGTVTFYDGVTSLGTGTVASGTATLTTSTLALGVHNVTATYSGDGSNLPATSPAVAETIVAASLTLSASPASLTVTRGSNGVTVITATPNGNFTGTVNFSCGTLPANASCVFVSPILTFTGTSTALSTTLTFFAKNQTTAALQPFRTDHLGILAAVFLPLGLVGLMRNRRRATQMTRLTVLLLAVTALAFGMTGCGSTATTTPAGTYTVPVNVSINGGTSQQLTLNVTVQ